MNRIGTHLRRSTWKTQPTSTQVTKPLDSCSEISILPAVHPRNTAARRRRQHLRDETPEADLNEVFAVFCIEDRQEDLLESAVERRVAEFVEPNN